MAGPVEARVFALLNGRLYVGTADALGKAITASTAELPDLVRALGKTLDIENLRTKKMLQANRRIARAAANAVSEGYVSRLPNPGHSQYRAGKNRLSGRLGPALASDAMIEGTSDRVISFINEDVLYHKAKHWYRVNYGSAGAGGVPAGEHTQPTTFEIGLGGVPLLTMRDPSPGDPTSHLPQFFYIKGEGEARELHVRPPFGEAASGQGEGQKWGLPAKVNEGNGTRAARFTDLGLAVVAKRFPNTYDKLFREYAEENRDRLAGRNIQVPINIRASRYGKFTVTER